MYYKSLRVFVKENISGRYRIAQILDEGFLLLFTVASYGCIETDESRYTVQIYVFSVRGEYVIIKNQSTKIDIFCYCSLRSQQHASRCRKYEPPCAMPKEYRLLRKLNLC